MQQPIDGLRPTAPAPLGRLLVEQRISADFVRQGGKGHYAGVTLLVKPFAFFRYEAEPSAWKNEVERQAYEPRLLQGILDQLLNFPGSQMLGALVVLEATASDERSSEFAFYSAGRLAIFRLLSDAQGSASTWLVTK